MLVDMEKVKDKINEMDSNQLSDYGITISMSELPRETKVAIYQEIEKRLDYLSTHSDFLACGSELREGET